MRIFRVGLLVGKTSKWTITDVWMHLTQREKKVENGDFFLLCYFELFPVTGAGINLFLRLRTRESGGCILLHFGRFPYYQPVR